MNVFLQTVNFTPLIYGSVMFLGMFVMWMKLINLRFLSLAIDIIVFTLVFKLHGGTMSGGFSAMIAALMAGLIFPRFIGR
jgi:hypothetical protein